MDFPDLNHFLQLQKYLWEWPSSRASVIVGAGLSLNSKPSPGVRTHFPSWSELARIMFDEIYPPRPDETTEGKKEREKQFNPGSALRFASEYEAAFGRPKLESLLLSVIPDSGHQPGIIHSLLLQLPWKDVFTTNYDTLLERTEVPGRSYQPVTTINDLITARAPRIIKLHGSFPSQIPFIITEEDYRTYPKCFAPFVNTVRQSLIENAVVLLGFSGDDPNFLEWIGWIRDELGDHHAPIYLVGSLSLVNVQRSLLNQRGVTAIDLSPVFSNKNLPGGTHAPALEWFLNSLLAAKPPRPEKWPETRISAPGTADIEPPILTVGLIEPEKVQYNGKQVLDEVTVMKLIKRWHFERGRYPGWLVPPEMKRSSLWRETEDWINLLVKFAENCSPVDRILLFREINWRLEVSMIPLFADWIAPFESAIDALLPDLEEGVCVKPEAMAAINISDGEVGEAWLEIAFALLREAREAYNLERWNAFKGKIDKIVANYPQFTDRYHYEQALWMMWNIERTQAKYALAAWSPSPDSPLALIWKAGILAELDELSEARSLLRTALREIRKSLHHNGQSVALLSLEGWCTYLLYLVELATNITRRPELLEEFSDRWQELKTWDCDPWQLWGYFAKVLTETPPALKKETEIVRGFDPWRSTTTHHIGGNDIAAWLPAFSCIRLYEQAGIPVRLAHIDMSGEALRNACKWIIPFTDFWSPAILIRAGKTDALTKHGLMGRVAVANMKLSLAESLNKWAMDALKAELSSLTANITMASAQESLLEVLIEVLSRLAFRLETSALQEAFSLALELHSHPGISSHIRLNKSCLPWFMRLFGAAHDRQLITWLPDLIRFTQNNGNHKATSPEPDFWPDPMSCFPAQRINPPRKAHLVFPTEINQGTDWLLEHAKSEMDEVRRRTIMRLVYVFDTGLMTKEQQEHFGIVLWEKTTENGLPDLPNLLRSNYLRLPVPSGLDVISKIKADLLSWKPGSGIAREDSMISDLAFVSKPVVQIPYEAEGIIEWNVHEVKELMDRLFKWWDEQKSVLLASMAAHFLGTEHILASLEKMGTFLARVVLPNMDSASEDEWNKVMMFMFDLRKYEVYLNTALLYILLHRSSEEERVFQTILDDLLSGNEKAVRASARAIRHWSYLADEGFLEDAPTAAIDELIRRVVFRRTEGIQFCLEQLTFLLLEKPNFFSSDQVNLIVASLTPWHQVTRLTFSEEDSGYFAVEERPELCVLIGRLASALSIWLKKKLPEQPEPSEISILREAYKVSPLPEVRRAFDTWKFLETSSLD